MKLETWRNTNRHEARALGLATWSDPRNPQKPGECLAASLHASWTPPVCSPGFCVKDGDMDVSCAFRVGSSLAKHFSACHLAESSDPQQFHSPAPGAWNLQKATISTYPNVWPNACQFASCSWAKASSCDETTCRRRLVKHALQLTVKWGGYWNVSKSFPFRKGEYPMRWCNDNDPNWNIRLQIFVNIPWEDFQFYI